MVELFRRSNPITFFALVIYTFAINLNLYIYPPAIKMEATAPLGNVVLEFLKVVSGGNDLVLTTVFILLVILQALMVNNIIHKHKLYLEHNSLSGFCYVLLIGLFNVHVYLSPAFFAGFAIIFALDKIYESYSSNNFSQPFDIGFAIAIASLFYFPAVILFFFMFVALNLTRVFRWRQWVVCLMGFLCPYFLFMAYYFYQDGLGSFAAKHFSRPQTTLTEEPLFLLLVILKALVIAAILIWFVYVFQNNYYKSVVKKGSS